MFVIEVIKVIAFVIVFGVLLFLPVYYFSPLHRRCEMEKFLRKIEEPIKAVLTVIAYAVGLFIAYLALFGVKHPTAEQFNSEVWDLITWIGIIAGGVGLALGIFAIARFIVIGIVRMVIRLFLTAWEQEQKRRLDQ